MNRVNRYDLGTFECSSDCIKMPINLRMPDMDVCLPAASSADNLSPKRIEAVKHDV